MEEIKQLNQIKESLEKISDTEDYFADIKVCMAIRNINNAIRELTELVNGEY